MREFTYVYAAVTPSDGELVWEKCDAMNTENMGMFLAKVSSKFPRDYILMIVDGASSHKAKALQLPSNIQLHVLPPYSPELNPTELLWDELREKYFANIVFASMAGVCQQLEQGMEFYSTNQDVIASLAGWPWILGAF